MVLPSVQGVEVLIGVGVAMVLLLVHEVEIGVGVLVVLPLVQEVDCASPYSRRLSAVVQE